MIDILLVLFFSCSLLPLVLALFQVLQHQVQLDPYIQDYVCINQLRKVMNVASDPVVHYDHVEFIYHNKPCSMGLLNHKLILKPGTRVYLVDVDEIYFQEENNCILLQYRRDETVTKRVIGYVPKKQE